MATGKREMGCIQLDPANFSIAFKFDAQVNLMEGAPSNAVKEGVSQVSTDRAKVGESPGQSRGRERAIDCRALVFDLRRQPDHRCELRPSGHQKISCARPTSDGYCYPCSQVN